MTPSSDLMFCLLWIVTNNCRCRIASSLWTSTIPTKCSLSQSFDYQRYGKPMGFCYPSWLWTPLRGWFWRFVAKWRPTQDSSSYQVALLGPMFVVSELINERTSCDWSSRYVIFADQAIYIDRGHAASSSLSSLSILMADIVMTSSLQRAVVDLWRGTNGGARPEQC